MPELPEPYWSDGERALYHGDCLAVLPSLPESSVSLVIADPPYFKVKREWWDRQWDKPEGFLSWLDSVLAELHRVLAPNGSLYLFASPKMAARVECLVAERFEVLNNIAWRKHDGSYNEGGLWSRADKEMLRRYFEQQERVIFAEHLGSDGYARGEAGRVCKCDELRGFIFEPLRAYLDGERIRAGVTQREVISACGMGGHDPHFFKVVQWALPTESNYLAIRSLFNARGNGSGPYLMRDWEDLRREYEDLRREYEDLRRPFNVSAEVPYTDVWDFPTVAHYPGKHPCEKPLAMMGHMVSVSSRPGDLVLDPFCGSGVSGEAARNLGRKWVGIDAEEKWCDAAWKRTRAPQPNLFDPVPAHA